MNTNSTILFPEPNLLLSRQEKEKLLCQKSLALWITGLSGSGKTSIAQNLEKKLYDEGFITKHFDGDMLRSKINKELDFSDEGRRLNIQRTALLNKEFLECGIIVINSFISPTIAIRTMAKDIIGEDDFIEIYLNCPLHICEKRDSKGLYDKARNGLIKNFTGIDSPYEPPLNPHLEIDTENCSINEAVETIYNFVVAKIKIK